MNDSVPNSISAVTPPIQPSVPPTTTLQQDKTLSGQRQVNVIWEITQAIIALVISIGVVAVAVHNGFTQKGDLIAEFPPTLSNAFFLIVGFYFSRTNHQAIGGIGHKANENQTYEGR